MDIIEKVKDLNLPAGEYVVVGSGLLAVLGLREAHDIDILVTEKVIQQLINQGFQKQKLSDNLITFSKDIYELGTKWHIKNFQPKTEDLIQRAQIIDGVPFVSFQDLLAYKKEFGREKDLRDIELIEKYQERKEE